MTIDVVWTVLFRWIHMVSACLLVGSAFYLYAIQPRAVRELDAQSRELVNLRSLRGFKMLVHSMILLLLVSGTYNAYRNWPAYRGNMPWTHALFGPHVLLGLIIFGVLLAALARRDAPRSRTWLSACVILMLLTIALASALKYAREHPKSAVTPSRMQLTAHD